MSFLHRFWNIIRFFFIDCNDSLVRLTGSRDFRLERVAVNVCRGGNLQMLAGPVLLLFGAAVFAAAWTYEIGELRRMGPGYFPMLLGATLCLFAALIALQDAKDRISSGRRARRTIRSGTGNRFQWRPRILPLFAILLFAMLLETAGFVPAVIAAVATAGFAERSNSSLAIAVIAAATAIFTSTVFVYLLGIPFRLFAV